jgi:hypothetical protein
MPGSHPPVTLRLEPHAIPAMRAALDESLTDMTAHVVRLGRDGYIAEPWLGDPVSAAVLERYHARVMDAPDGPYAALVAYEAELVKVRDTLVLLEEHYRRTEGENAERWGRA